MAQQKKYPLLDKKTSKLYIYLQPNAKKNEIVGMHDEKFLKIRIASPAIDNKANKALIQFLSQHLGIAKSCIKIISGIKSRYKTLEVHD
ncbi:MAG: YggU family protein [Gammaproteobacteria bacterium]|nr:YggU family protein [Gammaproteobacteria bacterium]